jgi:hydrogenase maturation protease
VLVIGLGNPLMRDEGVGLAVVQRLMERSERFPGVDFLEAGASLMGAMHRMAGRKKVLFVDCALMGAEPGTWRRFTPEQARSVKRLAGLSLHEGDLYSLLELSRRLGEFPEDVVIFGIEPAAIEMGEGLSDALRSRLMEYAQAVENELAAARIE